MLNVFTLTIFVPPPKLSELPAPACGALQVARLIVATVMELLPLANARFPLALTLRVPDVWGRTVSAMLIVPPGLFKTKLVSPERSKKHVVRKVDEALEKFCTAKLVPVNRSVPAPFTKA